jgi:hypothetical protein
MEPVDQLRAVIERGKNAFVLLNSAAFEDVVGERLAFLENLMLDSEPGEAGRVVREQAHYKHQAIRALTADLLALVQSGEAAELTLEQPEDDL